MPIGTNYDPSVPNYVDSRQQGVKPDSQAPKFFDYSSGSCKCSGFADDVTKAIDCIYKQEVAR